MQQLVHLNNLSRH